MHQPSLSVGWHPLDTQMHHLIKPVQSFNWTSSAAPTIMPQIIPLQSKLLFLMAVKKARNIQRHQRLLRYKLVSYQLVIAYYSTVKRRDRYMYSCKREPS